jgi:2-dehydropantoate 2-reductase
MRIAIFGTGGAGGYFGAQLAHAGEDVVFIARGLHLQAIRATGLRLDTPAGEIVIQRARVTDDPARVGEVDVVLLGVKAWQVTEAAEAMRPSRKRADLPSMSGGSGAEPEVDLADPQIPL